MCVNLKKNLGGFAATGNMRAWISLKMDVVVKYV